MTSHTDTPPTDPFAAATTHIDQIADGIYRLATPAPAGQMPGGFLYGQFLIVDDQPLLHHAGPHRMFAATRRAIETLIPFESLRWLSFGHGESDESGAMLDILDAAPDCEVVGGNMIANLVVDDAAPRPARRLGHGETLSLGRHEVMWLDTPHVPHNWEAGMMFETTTRTLLCGDLFTQFGDDHPPVTESDVLAPSEAIRARASYFSNPAGARPVIEQLAALEPAYLATMHGPVWKGDGRAMLLRLADALEGN